MVRHVDQVEPPVLEARWGTPGIIPPLRLKVSNIDSALTVASVMLDCNVKKFMTPLKEVKHLVGWLDMILICAR